VRRSSLTVGLTLEVLRIKFKLG